jgi:nitroreductase
MPTNTTTPDYGHLYDFIAKRMSIRRLKPDPIPDDYVRKILEAGRWAMSGEPS